MAHIRHRKHPRKHLHGKRLHRAHRRHLIGPMSFPFGYGELPWY